MLFQALLYTGIKIWCSTTTNSLSRLLECCCNNVKIFIDLFQTWPRDKEAGYLRFTIQRPGDLMYVPSLRPYAVLTIDTGKSTTLSGWDASMLLRCGIINHHEDARRIQCGVTTWHVEEDVSDAGPRRITTVGVFSSEAPSSFKITPSPALDLLGDLLYALTQRFIY